MKTLDTGCDEPPAILDGLATVGRLTAAVAHDMNNLLTIIMGYSHELRGQLGADAPARPAAEAIERASERAAELSRQLLHLSRPSRPTVQAVDLNSIVREVERLLRPLMPPQVHWLTLPDPALGLIRGDPGQLSQMLINLILNARDAMPDGGRLWVATARMRGCDIPPGKEPVRAHPYWAGLTVSDTGCGMSEQALTQLFEPFATTKPDGHGLGTVIVQQVVHSHGGVLRVVSQPSAGTTVTAWFPEEEPDHDGGMSLTPTPQSADDLPPSLRPLTAQETILLVEDHDTVRLLTTTVLRRHGYTVLEARNGREAVAASRDYPGPIQLLLADLSLPGLGGLELAQELTQARPGLKVLFTSGSLLESGADGKAVPAEAFLAKPFRPEDLLQAVRRALGG